MVSARGIVPGGVVKQLGFELGDPPVGEADVGAGGLQPFLQGPVVLGELADALFEGGVLGGDLADGLGCPFVFGVAGLNRPEFRAYFLTWEGWHVHAGQVRPGHQG